MNINWSIMDVAVAVISVIFGYLTLHEKYKIKVAKFFDKFNVRAIFRSGRFYYGDEIDEKIVKEIVAVKNRITGNNANLPVGEWDDKFRSVCAYLSRLLKNRLNAGIVINIQFQNPNMVWDDEIKTSLKNIKKLWVSDEFEEAFKSWCLSGIPGSFPDVKMKADVDPKVTDELSKRIAKKFMSWAHDKNWQSVGGSVFIDVLYVGANDDVLSKEILQNLSKTLQNTRFELNVYLEGVTAWRRVELMGLYNVVPGNVDRITIKEEDARRPEMYDVMICTHYYQHHDNQQYEEMLQKLAIRPDGLIVWLSAVSRFAGHDEYVCEGCLPLESNLISGNTNNIFKDAFRYGPIAVDPLTVSKITSYKSPRHSLQYELPFGNQYWEKHRWRILKTGFPKKFTIDYTRFYANPTQEVKGFLEFEKENGFSSAYDVVNYFGSPDWSTQAVVIQQVNSIKENSIKWEKKDEASCEYWCGVMQLKFAGNHDMIVLVTTLKESNIWNNNKLPPEDRKLQVTIVPALHSHWKNVQDFRQAVENVLRDQYRNQDSYYQDKVKRYLKRLQVFENSQNQDGSVAVINLDTDINEIDLNDMVFVCVKSDNGVDVYQSYLPKKRYLGIDQFIREYGVINEYERLNRKLVRGGAYEPVLRRSVTRLRDVDMIRSDFEKHGWRAEEQTIFFHKILGHVDPTDAVKGCYAEKFRADCKLDYKESCEYYRDDQERPAYYPKSTQEPSDSMQSIPDPCEVLKAECGTVYEKHSVYRDMVFNRLSYADRVKFLGVGNVHDVLMFFEKKGNVPTETPRYSIMKSVLRRVWPGKK